MSEPKMSEEHAEPDLLSCAVRVADSIETHEGHAEAMSVIALRYAAIGETEQAANLADAIEDPFVRDKTLSEIALRANELDQRDFALDLLSSVDDLSFQTLATGQIAVRAAEKGDYSEALEIAGNLDDPSATQSDIALRVFDAGEVSKAKEIISAIEYAGSRAYAYNEIASRHLLAGRKEEAVNALVTALAAIDRIDFSEEKISALIESANKHREAGDLTDKATSLLDQAREICEGVEEGITRDDFLSNLSLAYSRLGRFEKADECLDEISDPMLTASCLVGIATEHKLDGETDKALELLDEAYEIATSADLFLARSVYQRNNLLANMAIRYADLDRYEKAINAAKAIDSDEVRRVALMEIAMFYARLKGELETARQTANEIEDLYARSLCRLHLSVELAALSEDEEAFKLLEESRSLAQQIGHNYHKALAFAEISERYRARELYDVANDLLFQSLNLSPEISDKYEVALLLTQLSTKYGSANKEIGEKEREVLRHITINL
jgi:tetratricopeptide (TPR) repeat protein